MYGTGQGERLLGNRYRILRQLGHGGFGDTYLAEDINRFQELCVLKEFNPQVDGKFALDKAQTLFEREASILYQIDHPQIPRFRELLRDSGRLFLVQDYIEGPSYRELLTRRRDYDGHFSEAEVTQLLTQLLPVLQYLHSIGIVHRDISPDNLIQRNADGRPILIDFGGVKQLVVNVRHQMGVPQPYQSTEGEITRLGHGGYTPPEQLASGQVNPGTDLYALGITALVLLTGKEPAVLYDDRHQRWVWPVETNFSPLLQEVLSRLVARHPEDRYESASQVMAALNQAQPYNHDRAWTPSMPVRMQPTTPPPPLVPPATPLAPPIPAPTVAVAPGAPPATGMQYAPEPSPYTPPPRAVPVRRSSSGCLSAFLGLLLVGGLAAGLWWWLNPLGRFSETLPEAQTEAGSNAGNPAFSEVEQTRKQSLRDRALALGVDQAYLTRLTDQLFFEQYPERQGIPLTDQPQDVELRASWDAIALANLDLLEANLSPEARSRLGRYNPTDTDRWQRQVNQLFVSSKALNDLTDARFNQIFPERERGGFVETPIDQIWFGLAQDNVAALESGATLTEIQFDQGTLSQQLEGSLDPGEGQVYILNLSAGQLMRLNLQAPPDTTRLSFYVPVPTDDLQNLLADAQQTTWAGELPQSGYYEIVVVSTASSPIAYQLTVGVDNVQNDIINKPAAPEKNN